MELAAQAGASDAEIARPAWRYLAEQPAGVRAKRALRCAGFTRGRARHAAVLCYIPRRAARRATRRRLPAASRSRPAGMPSVTCRAAPPACWSPPASPCWACRPPYRAATTPNRSTSSPSLPTTRAPGRSISARRRVHSRHPPGRRRPRRCAGCGGWAVGTSGTASRSTLGGRVPRHGRRQHVGQRARALPRDVRRPREYALRR